MRHVNNNHNAPLVILPPAYAKGAESGATVGSRCASTFVDVVPANDPESEHRHALWRAVIVQHIMDAKSTSRKPEKLSLKSQALDWLFRDEINFTMVCDLAGWEPDYVRSLCIIAESQGFRRRKESRHA